MTNLKLFLNKGKGRKKKSEIAVRCNLEIQMTKDFEKENRWQIDFKKI